MQQVNESRGQNEILLFNLMTNKECPDKSAPISKLRQLADYISFALGSLGPLWYVLKNGVLLMYTLEGVSSVANFITAYEGLNKTETPIF